MQPNITSIPASSGSAAEATLLGKQRRRSQRALLRIRAKLHLVVQGEEWVFEGFTETVSPHGALVLMPKALPALTHLVLENCHTGERVPCRVARPAQESEDGFRIPLAFDCPTPNFWKIAFPPTDWNGEGL